jgi:hypothetical protein
MGCLTPAKVGDPYFINIQGQQVSIMTDIQGFKVSKMVGPNGISASALAREVGIPQQSLSRWPRDANVVDESVSFAISTEYEIAMSKKRPQDNIEILS